MTIERKVVGRVTPRERDEIRTLYERKNGLNELILSLQDHELLRNPLFYDKVVADLGSTVTRFRRWWDDKAAAYGWEGIDGGHWTIDFETCEILLSGS
jgi:CXXX repeat modification system protein